MLALYLMDEEGDDERVCCRGIARVGVNGMRLQSLTPRFGVELLGLYRCTGQGRAWEARTMVECIAGRSKLVPSGNAADVYWATPTTTKVWISCY